MCHAYRDVVWDGDLGGFVHLPSDGRVLRRGSDSVLMPVRGCRFGWPEVGWLEEGYMAKKVKKKKRGGCKGGVCK